MTIDFATHRLGADEDAVGRLINGDLPGDDERWQMLDAPRYHIERLLNEHERAQAALRRCRDEHRPFALFLRSFGAEARPTRDAGFFGTHLSLAPRMFEERIAAMLELAGIPLVRLHGGSDGFYPGSSNDALILSTHERNWLDVATDLVGSAAVIVFLVSHVTPGVLEELNLVRKLGRTLQCILVVTDAAATPTGDNPSSSLVDQHLDGFEHVLHSAEALLEPPELEALLARLLAEAAVPCGTLDQAISAPFSYVEPSFLESDDYRATQAQLWRWMRILRVMFDDTYWSALKAQGVAFDHFRFPAAWQLAHRLFGLGVVAMDLRAAREALRYIELMSYLRGADYALMLPHLAQQYAALAPRIWPKGEPDTETMHAAGPDVLTLPASTRTAVALFVQAEKLAQGADVDMAGCLYQAAAISALRADDGEAAHRRWIVANICRGWAGFQSATQPAWAVTNLAFAVGVLRDLAQRDRDFYSADLALTLNNLGVAYFNGKDYAACESAWTEALALRRATPAEAERFHENLWTSLFNLALVRVEQARFDDACALYDEAASVARRLPGERAATHLSRALALKSQCLSRAGDRLEEAALCARNAEDALRDLPPERAAELRDMLAAALGAAASQDGRVS